MKNYYLSDHSTLNKFGPILQQFKDFDPFETDYFLGANVIGMDILITLHP